MRLTRLLFAATLLAGCASVRKPPALFFERSTGAVNFTATARGIDRLRLVGGVADISVSGTTDSTIHAEVELRSTDADRLKRDCLPSVRIDTTRNSEEFTMTVSQHSRNKCGERWHVYLPRNLAASVTVTHGTVEVNDVRGGLTAVAKVQGKIRGTVGGTVDVRIGVGDVDLRATDTQYGTVELTSKVGRTSLVLNGYTVSSDGRPGSGDRIMTRGRGAAAFRAHSRVGTVSATIGQ